MRHLRHWHVYLYPKDMRDRYLSEIEALTEELLSDTTFRRSSLVFDLVLSAFRARIQQWRPRRWLALALSACAITAGLLVVVRTSPSPPFQPVASPHQGIIHRVPPKQCVEPEQAANSAGYLCSMTLNPKTGATESDTVVPLTPQLADCLRRQHSGQSVVTCLPLMPHNPNR
jgi:hypothetical protein